MLEQLHYHSNSMFTISQIDRPAFCASGNSHIACIYGVETNKPNPNQKKERKKERNYKHKQKEQVLSCKVSADIRLKTTQHGLDCFG